MFHVHSGTSGAPQRRLHNEGPLVLLLLLCAHWTLYGGRPASFPSPMTSWNALLTEEHDAPPTNTWTALLSSPAGGDQGANATAAASRPDAPAMEPAAPSEDMSDMALEAIYKEVTDARRAAEDSLKPLFPELKRVSVGAAEASGGGEGAAAWDLGE